MTTARQSEIYGVTQKTICQWKNAGLTHGFPCPLDEPEHMPEWWNNMVQEGVFSKSCPVKVMVAAGQAGEGEDDDEALGSDEGSMGIPMGRPPQKKVDYEQAVAIAESNVAAVERLLADAKGDYAKTVSLQRAHKDSQDTLRALRRDKRRIEMEAGEVLSKADVREAMLEIHSNIQKRLRQDLKSIYPVIPDHTATLADWNRFIDSTMDTCCKALTDSGFAAD